MSAPPNVKKLTKKYQGLPVFFFYSTVKFPSTQLFHTSKAGVVMIALMFVLGFVTFYLQGRQEAVSAGTESHPEIG